MLKNSLSRLPSPLTYWTCLSHLHAWQPDEAELFPPSHFLLTSNPYRTLSRLGYFIMRQKRYANKIQIYIFQVVDILVVLYYIGTVVCQVCLLTQPFGRTEDHNDIKILLSWALFLLLLFVQAIWYEGRERITREWMIVPFLKLGWALEPPRFSGASSIFEEKPQQGLGLCRHCRQVLRKSALLTGTRWIATRNLERLTCYTNTSAGERYQCLFTCQLCVFLRLSDGNQSIVPTTFVARGRRQYGTFSASAAVEPEYPLLVIFQPPERGGRTYIQFHNSHGDLSKGFEVLQRAGSPPQTRGTQPTPELQNPEAGAGLRPETQSPEERYKERLSSTGKEQTFRLARAWINKCSHDH